jgi:predicted glycoside hydrolase/deacetylase ChbG (UPF0249 family)
MILCADDYGLNDDINEAILELVDAGRLSAVSCMVVLERCSAACLGALLKHQSRVDVGLHLCLTSEELPLSVSSTGAALPLYPSFGALLRDALLGRVQTEAIRSQVAAQYELFVQKCGRRPHYIDGHLHAHQLPGVREALLDFVLALPADSRTYIRNTRASLRSLWRRRLPWLKAAMIGFYGARMEERLREAHIPTNKGFAGIYDFKKWSQYPDYFPRFKECLPQSNGILVVHPGKKEEWRRGEFEVLRRFEFGEEALNRFQVAQI